MAQQVAVILVAGGSGTRMGQSRPKAFLPVGGIPLLLHALKTFVRLPEIHGVVLVVPAGQEPRAAEICQTLGTGQNKVRIVCGGAQRQDSVQCGMAVLAEETDLVLIHDAARPFCSPELIRRVIQSAAESGAAIPGIPVVDTLKRVDGQNRIAAAVDRSRLMAVQTPQGFKREILFRAYQEARDRHAIATDDASLVELLGLPVTVVAGETMNFKLTQPQDLILAELWLQQQHPQ